VSGERTGCAQGCGVVALVALAGVVLVVGLSAIGAWLSSRGTDRATAPPTSQRYYTVQSGDTLGRIAARHGVPVATLTRANRLPDPDRLEVGEVLTIPPHSAAPPPRARSNPTPAREPHSSDAYSDWAARRGVDVGDCAAYWSGEFDRALRSGGFMRLLTCYNAEASDMKAEHARILAEWTESDPPACADLYDYVSRLRGLATRTEAVAKRGEVEPMRGFLRDTLGHDLPTRLRATLRSYEQHRQDFERTLGDLCKP